MIECTKCGAEYPTERLFCGKCKEPLGIRCPVCGFINLLDDLFCGICLAEFKAGMKIPVGQAADKHVSSPSSLYEEIQKGIQEDAAFANTGERISQQEIEDIFQEDEEE